MPRSQPTARRRRSPTFWRRFLRRMRKVALYGLVAFFGLSLICVALYRFVPPPITPLMIQRSVSGVPIRGEGRWLDLEKISPNLIRAVVAAEDQTFCAHWGVDWKQLGEAVDDALDGDRPRGASTISMQTSRNVFLWPVRTYIRKLFELYFTLLIETLWDKERILEVYLNVIEWGDGIYGADDAARHYFGTSASNLGPQRAALLAAILPNPRRWSASRPTDYIRGRAAELRRQMRIIPVAGKYGLCPAKRTTK